MRIFLAVIFIFFGSVGDCQHKISDSSRKKGIDLYNEFVKQDSIYYQLDEKYGDDSVIFWHYNPPSILTSIFVRKKMNDNFYVETNYWFLHAQLIHVFITFQRKNWRNKWKDNRYGWYTFNDNLLLDFHERKIPKQNVDSLIRSSAYYVQKGTNRLKISN